MNNKYLLIILSTLVFTGCSLSSKNTYTNGNSNINNSPQASNFSPEQRQDIALTALSMMETSYNWGGKKPDFGVDCSGLVSYVFAKSVNYKITGSAKHMALQGKDISIDKAFNRSLAPGDLLFFNTTGKSYSHVGIYIGDSKFLHASSGKGKVILSSINNKYFKSKLERIKRI